MNYYIADTHFMDYGIAKYQSPFSHISEMNETIIHNWNSKVKDSDDVYVIGDFFVNDRVDYTKILKRLHGKIHLIVGNHDLGFLKNIAALNYISSVDDIKYIKDGSRTVCLCHYPIAEWSGKMKGVYHVYGHIHRNSKDIFKFMYSMKTAFCCSCGIVDYTPCTLEELSEKNKIYSHYLD